MDSKDLFYIAVLNHPPARNIFVKDNAESVLLFAYSDNIIHISKLSIVNGAVGNDKHLYDGETLIHESIIVNIFAVSDIFYGVDKDGTLFTISTGPRLDVSAEYDLFDDSPEESPDKWATGNKIKATDSVVLNSCLPGENQLALLTSSPSNISLEIVNLGDGCQVAKYLIRSLGLIDKSDKQINLLKWIPMDEIAPVFWTSWFRKGREETGFFVIVLAEGSIFIVFPKSGEVEHLKIWQSSPLACYWDYTPQLPGSEAVGSCSLILITELGKVLTLTEVGETDVSYLPVEKINSIFRDQFRNIYLSDWNNSYRVTLPSSKGSFQLSLKGILCWGGYGKQYTIALSKHGEVIVINNLCKISELSEVSVISPDSSMTGRIIRQIAVLDNVNSLIAHADNYIEALGIANRNIKFSLNAQIITVRRQEYTVCLNFKCQTEEVTLDKNDWLLSLCLMMESGDTSIFTYRLRRSILSSLSYTQVFVLTPKHSLCSQLTIELTLFFKYHPSYTVRSPTIFIGVIELDPSYFLVPGVELDYCYFPSEQNFNDEDNLFEKISVEIGGKEGIKRKIVETGETKLAVPLSEQFPKASLFKTLLENSKTLWRASQWTEACENKELEVALCNNLIKLELSENDNSVVISGSDVESCHLVKLAIYLVAPTAPFLNLEKTTALNQFENYSAVSELYEHLDKPLKDKFQELFNQWRETIFLKFNV